MRDGRNWGQRQDCGGAMRGTEPNQRSRAMRRDARDLGLHISTAIKLCE